MYKANGLVTSFPFSWLFLHISNAVLNSPRVGWLHMKHFLFLAWCCKAKKLWSTTYLKVIELPVYMQYSLQDNHLTLSNQASRVYIFFLTKSKWKQFGTEERHRWITNTFSAQCSQKQCLHLVTTGSTKGYLQMKQAKGKESSSSSSLFLAVHSSSSSIPKAKFHILTLSA